MWPYTERATVRPSAPQGNQCLLSHFLASLGACNQILHINVVINWQLSEQGIRWSVSPYRIAGSSVRLIEVEYFFEVIRWQITSFKWSQAQVYFFPMIHMKYVVFMSLWPRTIKILISNWPRTRKFSQFFKNTGGEDLFLPWSRVTLYVQFLCSDWSKFDRWAHVEKLCSILKVVYFDGWSWQSFVSTCDVFNCIFPLDVQNEIQLLSRGWFVYWVLIEKASLVKIR